jgi:hypothetical protein
MQAVEKGKETADKFPYFFDVESLCNNSTERGSLLPLRARLVLRSTHDAAAVQNVALQLIDHCRRRVRRAV